MINIASLSKKKEKKKLELMCGRIWSGVISFYTWVAHRTILFYQKTNCVIYYFADNTQ